MRCQYDKIRYKREWKTNTHMWYLAKQILNSSSLTIVPYSLSLGIDNGEGRFLKERTSVKSDML